MMYHNVSMIIHVHVADWNVSSCTYRDLEMPFEAVFCARQSMLLMGGATSGWISSRWGATRSASWTQDSHM